jgi:hypothetical protein
MSPATAVAGVPFDLMEVKLAASLTRPGIVVKESLIARLRTVVAPFATVVAPAGYRKFGISSRSEAIERAVEVGLLESSILPPRVGLIQDG